MRRYGLWLAGALVPILVGCSGTNGSSTSASTSNLVTEAATQAQTTHDTAKSCFRAFQACIDQAADATAVTACQQTLASCLPPAPNLGPPPDLCSTDDPDGRPHHRGPGCSDGGAPPPPGDGGLRPPPPGPGALGDHDDHDGRHGPGLPVSPAGRIALATCHAELHKCLTAGTDATTCITQAHQCVHDALAAEFAQLCDSIAQQCAACSTSPRCTELTARCAAGLALGDHP